MISLCVRMRQAYMYVYIIMYHWVSVKIKPYCMSFAISFEVVKSMQPSFHLRACTMMSTVDTHIYGHHLSAQIPVMFLPVHFLTTTPLKDVPFALNNPPQISPTYCTHRLYSRLVCVLYVAKAVSAIKRVAERLGQLQSRL